jgi:hypothetical protein
LTDGFIKNPLEEPDFWIEVPEGCTP